MPKLDNARVKKLAMDLLRADSEDDVIRILREANLWEDRNLWRLYGDKEGNFAPWQMSALASELETLARRKETLDKIVGDAIHAQMVAMLVKASLLVDEDKAKIDESGYNQRDCFGGNPDKRSPRSRQQPDL